jgi:thymidine phosphorylase
MTLAAAGGGRTRPDDPIDPEVALRTEARLGDRVEQGDALARLHLRRRDPVLEARASGCFAIAETGFAPRLIHDRIPPSPG